MQIRWKSFGFRALAVLLGLLFLAAGLPKLIAAPNFAEQFAAWGYPAWLPRLVGLGETLGALTILVGRFNRPGSALLVAIMIGAAVTHIRVGEWSRVPFVVILILALMALFYRARETRDIVDQRKQRPAT